MKKKGNTISSDSDREKIPDGDSLLGIYRNSPIPTCVIRDDGHIADINQAMIDLFGISEQKLAQTRDLNPWIDVLFTDKYNNESARLALQKMYTSRRPERSLLTITKENKQNLTLIFSAFKYQSPEHRASFFIIHAIDISESKNIESSLHEIERRYQALFYRTLDLMYIHDLSGHLIDANPAALRLFGLKRKEITSLDFSSLLSSEQIPAFVKKIKEIQKHGFQQELIEYRLRKKDNSFVYIQANGVLIFSGGKPFAVLCIGRDVTEQKKSEEIRRSYITKLDFLARSATELVKLSRDDNIYMTIAGHIKQILGTGVVAISAFHEKNNSFETMVISGIEEHMDSVMRILKHNPAGMTYPAGRKIKTLLLTGEIYSIHNLYDLTMRTISAGICHMLEMIFGVQNIVNIGFSSKGRLYGVATIMTFANSNELDKELIETYCSQVSVALQRWKAEKELKISEEKYHALTENINDIIYSMNTDGIITHVGSQVRRYGYQPDDVIGKPLSFLIHQNDRPATLTDLKRTLETGELFPSRFRLIDSYGNDHWFEDNSMIQRGSDGTTTGIFGILRDITWRIDIEEALRISEAKLRAQKDVLEHKTYALTEIVAQIEIEKNRIKDDVITNVEKIMLPILDKLRLKKNPDQYIELLTHVLRNLTSSFGRKLTMTNTQLTPREIEICSMIESGLHTKEISHILNVTPHTIENHRKSIRKKLGIQNKGVNLTTFLKNPG